MEKKFDMVKIKKKLFSDEKIRKNIANALMGDVAQNCDFTSPDDFCSAVVKALKQQVVLAPLNGVYSNRELFRAAAFALASNSRKWSDVVKKERELSVCLHDYDPKLAAGVCVEDIMALLKGGYPRRDANAIMNWRKCLSQMPEEKYYEMISTIGRILKKDTRVNGDAELMMCIAVFFGNPSKEFVCKLGFDGDANRYKWPGMGPVLGSEFLRNLGWNGFKPDRHIKRLIARWYPEGLELESVRNDVRRLCDVVCRYDKETEDYVKFSLLGIKLTPVGYDFSQVDNLVWLLGAMVEKKNKESNENYLHESFQ